MSSENYTDIDLDSEESNKEEEQTKIQLFGDLAKT